MDSSSIDDPQAFIKKLEESQQELSKLIAFADGLLKENEEQEDGDKNQEDGC